MNAVLSAMGPDNYPRARELASRAAVDWGVDGDIVTYGTLLLLASARLPPPAPLVPAGGATEGIGQRFSKGSRRLSSGEGDGVGGGEEDGEWETVTILRRAVAAKAVPSEACLDMVVFGLARDGLWDEASAFVEEIGQSRLKVSRHQVRLSCLSHFFCATGRSCGVPCAPSSWKAIGLKFFRGSKFCEPKSFKIVS